MQHFNICKSSFHLTYIHKFIYNCTICNSILGQTDVSRCESSPMFQGLTPTLSSGCVADGLEESKQFWFFQAIRTLKWGTESVPETLENFHTLTWLSAQKHIIEFRHRESLKIYTHNTQFGCTHILTIIHRYLHKATAVEDTCSM